MWESGKLGGESSGFRVKTKAKCQWLMLVILPTWEAEIRRISVQGQPGQRVLQIPSPK
jgi:hypothetical protein